MLIKLSLLVLCSVHLGRAIEVRTDGFPPGNPQNWGHITVRDGAHMFWWMHFTKAAVPNYTDRPLIFWLQGGPGSSSSGYGNFEILGPVDLGLHERNFTWINTHNVLFVDNPVGTGFSYVDDISRLSTTNKQIALDLVELLRGVYAILPEFRTVPLHIFGESYGGKMGIEFAHELNLAIEQGTIRANLQAAYLGDAWISPIDSTLSWAPYLLNLGFVDIDGYQKINNMARRTERVLHQEQYTLATDLWYMTEVVVDETTHGVDYYNVLYDVPGGPAEENVGDASKSEKFASPRDHAFNLLVNYEQYRGPSKLTKDHEPVRTLNQMMRDVVHPALALYETIIFGSQSGIVFDTLAEDFMKPVVDVVAKVLNETSVKVVVYSGQLDLICSTPGTVEWINAMNWHGKKQYARAPRRDIRINRILEGYVRQYGNFSMYWLNRAGHMAPRDNPRATSVMLEETTNFASDF